MKRSMISFDWAMKRLLRNKANFEVLEGFLSELLRRKIIINHTGESEGTPTDKDDKTNRVDILVEADEKEIIIVELQFDSVAEYFHRMLFKAPPQPSPIGREFTPFGGIKGGGYFINIVHFGLDGDDYVYHGFTNFKGLHTKNELQLTAAQQKLYSKKVVGEIYPEYYIISVRGLNDVAKDSLDEWIYYLKNNRIEDHFTAQGLDKAKEVLLFDNLTPEEQEAYLRDIDAKLLNDSAITTAQLEGEIRGEAKGEHKKAVASALKMLEDGMSIEIICKYTGLTHEQITEIQQENQ